MQENRSAKQRRIKYEAINALKKIIFDSVNAAYDNGTIITVNDIADLPMKSAVYFIHDENNIIYIGKSRNLFTRFHPHEQYKPGLLISYWRQPVDQLDWLENVLIAIYKPSKNKIGICLDIGFLNRYDISEITGISYQKKRYRLNFKKLSID